MNPAHLSRVALLGLAGLVAGCAAIPGPPDRLLPRFGDEACPLFTIGYHNNAYGFRLMLPADWSGYRVEMKTWTGDWSGSRSDPVPTGPYLVIHHPRSTPERPRQEIPFEIYTTDQWALRVAGQYSVGAAGVLGLETARNSQYVFNLPPRFNYAFPEGWEDVDLILRCYPIVTFEPWVETE